MNLSHLPNPRKHRNPITAAIIIWDTAKTQKQAANARIMFRAVRFFCGAGGGIGGGTGWFIYA